MHIYIAAIDERMYWEGLWIFPDYLNFTIIYWLIVGGILGSWWWYRKRRQLARWPIGVAGLMAPLFFYIAAPIVISATAASSKTIVLQRAKTLALGVLMYSSDHDDRLPLANNWESVIKPYMKGTMELSPGRYYREGARFAYNRNLSGVGESEIDLPNKVVMIFVSALPGPSASGGEADLLTKPGTMMEYFAFADGTARWGMPTDVYWRAVNEIPEPPTEEPLVLAGTASDEDWPKATKALRS